MGKASQGWDTRFAKTLGQDVAPEVDEEADAEEALRPRQNARIVKTPPTSTSGNE